MLKILLKKELMEIWKFFFFDSKKGKRRSKKSMIMYGCLYVFLFGYLAVIFGALAYWLGDVMFPIGLGWFYFLLMALLAIVYGAFGSVFNTFATVYLPKDNDTMIPLPIKEGDMVISRLAAVYVMGLFYSSMVFLPAIVIAQVIHGFHLTMLLGSIIMMIVSSLIVLVISAGLGYVVALVSVKVRSKAFITVLISLSGIGIYIYVYTKILNGINSLLEAAVTASITVKNQFYFLYALGNACMGDLKAVVIYTLITLIAVYVTYYLIKKSFIKIATMNKGEKKVAYKMQKSEVSSVNKALFMKELRYFTHSATYMLNCGLGILFMVIGGCYMLFKLDTFEMIRMLFVDVNQFEEIIALAVVAAIGMMAGMCYISTPSISLEGKNIYILQSLPIDGWAVLKSKLTFHLVLTIPSSLFLSTIMYIGLGCDIGTMIMMSTMIILMNIFFAAFGLFIGIKYVNLNWTNEGAVIKQSLAVFISMFGSWLFIITLGIATYFLMDYVSITTLSTIYLVLLALVCRFLLQYLKTKGALEFSQL